MMLTGYVAVAAVCDAVPDAVLPNELELSELYKLHVICKWLMETKKSQSAILLFKTIILNYTTLYCTLEIFKLL
jgi:hypothetical protein